MARWRPQPYRSVRKSGTQEGRTPHPLSFSHPPLRGCPVPNSDIKAPLAKAARGKRTTRSPCPCRVAPFSSRKHLSSLWLQHVWRESGLHPLWLFKTTPCGKGNFCSFLPSLRLTAAGSWEGWRKMCQWKMRSKAVVHVVRLF